MWTRTLWALTGIAVSLITVFTPEAHAQAKNDEAYPIKAIRLVVPFPPGGGVDAVARLAGNRSHFFRGYRGCRWSRAQAGRACQRVAPRRY